MKLIASQPCFCPKKDVDHNSDAEMEQHGTPESPIEVEEKRDKKYIQWEYEYILRKMPTPYNKCQQQLYDGADDRHLDRIVVRDVGGKHHVFWFDVTEQLDLSIKKLDKVYQDMKAKKPVRPFPGEGNN